MSIDDIHTSYMSVSDYRLLAHGLAGTCVESSGSCMDEVWASTSCESSAMVIYYDDMHVELPWAIFSSYNDALLWHLAERLVLGLKRASMQPFMFRHDFVVLLLKSGFSHINTVMILKDAPVLESGSQIVSQYGGAVTTSTQTRTRCPRLTVV